MAPVAVLEAVWGFGRAARREERAPRQPAGRSERINERGERVERDGWPRRCRGGWARRRGRSRGATTRGALRGFGGCASTSSRADWTLPRGYSTSVNCWLGRSANIPRRAARGRAPSAEHVTQASPSCRASRSAYRVALRRARAPDPPRISSRDDGDLTQVELQASALLSVVTGRRASFPSRQRPRGRVAQRLPKSAHRLADSGAAPRRDQRATCGDGPSGRGG